MKPVKSGRLGFVGSLGAALLALTGSVWAGTQSQPVVVDEAPQAWVDYAQRVAERLQSALSADAALAQEFGAFFDEWVTRNGQASAATTASTDEGPLTFGDASQAAVTLPTLKVRVWLDRSGHVTQVGFDEAAIGSERAVADLRALLLQQSVDAPPPRMMKQPVVIRLVPGAQL
ncbi:hypothetical protein [Pararobbsia silviterrae]|uniref:YbaB/EbfC family DNA-binding protein n=1 Tax=Pararobbsia silviterrae TaxID=1792498 RepID=A0A494Y552_9BURK|nr:hypothetical protein [Pararobbsia silviterrae]RKP57829.1 hypothetical protein D7S86_07865 [Pararobbsia silviterrae]